MGTDISPGLVFVDGMLVHDAELNTAIGDSTILATAISTKTLKSEMSLGDELLINDTGTLKKVTGQQIVSISAVPAGCMMDYAGSTEPLGWAFCYGQALSRTTYAALYAAIGDAFAQEDDDDDTVFRVPDCRGRVTAGQDDMGGTSANRLVALNGDILGGVGGEEKHILTEAQLASHAHYASVSVYGQGTFGGSFNGSCSVSTEIIRSGNGTIRVDGGSWGERMQGWTGTCGGSTSTFVGFTSTGGGATDTRGTGEAHNNLQPTIIMNKIIKT